MRLGLAAIGALAVLCTGCGGSKESRTTIVTVTNVSTVTTTPPPGAHDYDRFQLPSRNIGCGFDSGVLRCDILSGLSPEPTETCELDWTGIVLEADRPAQPECAGDTIYDASAPVLAYGETWLREEITCVSAKSGLECESAAGHGFMLARASWRVS